MQYSSDLGNEWQLRQSETNLSPDDFNESKLKEPTIGEPNLNEPDLGESSDHEDLL